MIKFIRLKIIFLFIIVFSGYSKESREVMIKIIPVQEDFFDNAESGKSPDLINKMDEIYIIGALNIIDFSIDSINNIALYNEKKIIPLIIDQASIYSEFDETKINSMTISFFVKKNEIKKNNFKLIWGSSIKADNKIIESIPVYFDSKDHYMTFSLEEIKKANKDDIYSNTLEVIVDDYADIYFIWYLLPILLIIIMVIVRRFVLK